MLRLIELIAHLNRTIHLHRQQPEPDTLMLAEYTDRRATYLDQLAELMGESYGLEARFRALD